MGSFDPPGLVREGWLGYAGSGVFETLSVGRGRLGPFVSSRKARKAGQTGRIKHPAAPNISAHRVRNTSAAPAARSRIPLKMIKNGAFPENAGRGVGHLTNVAKTASNRGDGFSSTFCLLVSGFSSTFSSTFAYSYLYVFFNVFLQARAKTRCRQEISVCLFSGRATSTNILARKCRISQIRADAHGYAGTFRESAASAVFANPGARKSRARNNTQGPVNRDTASWRKTKQLPRPIGLARPSRIGADSLWAKGRRGAARGRLPPRRKKRVRCGVAKKKGDFSSCAEKKVISISSISR